MKRTILLIVVLFTVAVFLSYTALQKRPAQQLTTPTPTPVGAIFPTLPLSPTQAPVPTGTTIVVNGITVNNFYLNATPLNAQGDWLLAEMDGEYRIVYLAAPKQFLLTITGSPFDINRQTAEQKLLELLNISKPDACLLSVVIKTPTYANSDQSGQDYPLSFCQ